MQEYVSGIRPSSNPYMLRMALIKPRIDTSGIICILSIKSSKLNTLDTILIKVTLIHHAGQQRSFLPTSQWAEGAIQWTFCYIQLKKGKLMVIKTNFQLLQSSEVCRRCLCLLNIDLSCDLEKNLYQNITIPRGRNVLESYKSIILKLAKDNYAW